MPSRISPPSRNVSEFSRFPGGGGSFPQYLTSLQSEPPPPYFPKPKTSIVPRGTHILFIIECVPNFSALPKCFRIFKVSRGRRLFSSIPYFYAIRAAAPILPEAENSDCSTWNTQFVHNLTLSRISPSSRNVSEFSRFPGGGGSFPQYLTSLQSEPPPSYFPKLKTIVAQVFHI